MSSFKVKPQHVYLDKKSVEPGVGTKHKYKLAGYQFPIKGTGHPQLFWVLTSQTGRYSIHTSVTVEPHHWTKIDNYCLKKTSYISHDHSENITKAELLIKRRDISNKFEIKARLNDDKFEEFKSRVNKIKLTPKRTIDDLMIIATSTTNNHDDAKDILKQLHLG